MLSDRTVARGACFADYDNDGKVDAYVVNLGAEGTLLHNVSTDTGHWIEVKLVGTKSNRDGIGARVEVMAGGKRWTAERVASSGYLSQNDGRVALRARRGDCHRQTDRSLAERARADAGETSASIAFSPSRSREMRPASAAAVQALAAIASWPRHRSGCCSARLLDMATTRLRPIADRRGLELRLAGGDFCFRPTARGSTCSASRAMRCGCSMRPHTRRSRPSRWATCRAAFRSLPTGDRLFVANSWDDTVSVIDTRSLEVIATWPVGAEPSSVVEDPRRQIRSLWPIASPTT